MKGNKDKQQWDASTWGAGAIGHPSYGHLYACQPLAQLKGCDQEDRDNGTKKSPSS